MWELETRTPELQSEKPADPVLKLRGGQLSSMIPGSKPLRINVCEAKVPTDEAAAAGGAAAVGAVIGADEAHAKRACPRARCSVFVLICMCVSASVSVGLLFLYVNESVYVLLLARNLNLMRCFESYE